MSRKRRVVYDMVFPSAPLLENLALSAVAIALWRREIIIHRTDKSLDKLNPNDPSADERDQWPRIPVKSIIHAPSKIIFAIEKCTESIGKSIRKWLSYHYEYVFRNHRTICSDVFNDFDDLVCDFDDTIHFDRTAKRMLKSDGISRVEKFQIACLYSFEEEIARMAFTENEDEEPIDINRMVEELPSVQVNYIRYWIAYLGQISGEEYFEEDLNFNYVFDDPYVGNWSLIKHAWSNLESFERLQAVNFIFSFHPIIFTRYVFLKWYTRKFSSTIDEAAFVLLIANLVLERLRNYAMAVLMHAYDKLTKKFFFYLFNEIFCEQRFDDDDWEEIVSIVCDIWKNAPDDSKQSMIRTIRHILSNETEYNFDSPGSALNASASTKLRACNLLISTILSDDEEIK